MIVERIQGGSRDSLETHEATYYQRARKLALKTVSNVEGLVLDPFARYCPWGDIRNDLNPACPTQYHLDARDFLKLMVEKHGQGSMKLILFDPPFSENQAERYLEQIEGEVINAYTIPGYLRECFDLCTVLLASGGVLLKLGYNTSRPSPNLELIRLSVVNFGGNRNDVLVSHWINPNHRLPGL